MDIPRLVEAVSGMLIPPADVARCEVAGLAWDSREVGEGDAFAAWPGARVDGNDFVSAAIEAGAAAALVTRAPDDATLREAVAKGCAMVLVQDGPQAVWDLARAWRAMVDPVCLAVTGSSGKTTTKDLLACVLSFMGPVAATRANQNNELGVPATIISANDKTAVLVVEVGMRGRHQIEKACTELIKPQIGIVTNVGTSHLELLGSRENIARAKAELLQALPDGGLAVIPGDDDFAELLGALAQKDREAPLQMVTFGLSADCDVRAEGLALDACGLGSFELALPDGDRARVALQLPGEHNAVDALAAAAVAWRLGADAATIARLLGQAHPRSMRMEIVRAAGGFRVIDDAYNANPDSMAAALDVLGRMEVAGRRVAVLGDMGELGDKSPKLHRLVGAKAARSGVDLLVCVGELARGIAEGAKGEGMPEDAVCCVSDALQALGELTDTLSVDDVVLVKASHSMGLSRVARGLVGKQ